MKTILIFLFYFCLTPILAGAIEPIQPSEVGWGLSIFGEWKFVQLIYRDQRLPLPNPDLNMTWTFFENGLSRLRWDRGTQAYCERWATYRVEDSFLEEQVIRTSSEDDLSCENDPDMQLGKITRTPFSLSHAELQLSFNLGDETLIYVLKRIGH